MKIFTSALDRFRLIALLEGISFIVLVFIAMPVKYLGYSPLPVKYTGWAHGVLFVLYLVCLLQVWMEERWSFGRVALAFLASLLPFGPFLFERKLRRQQTR